MDFENFTSQLRVLNDDYPKLESYGFLGADVESCSDEVLSGLLSPMEQARREGCLMVNPIEYLMQVVWLVEDFFRERGFLRKLWLQRLLMLAGGAMLARIALMKFTATISSFDQIGLMLGAGLFLLLFFGGRQIGGESWFYKDDLSKDAKSWWDCINTQKVDNEMPFAGRIVKLKYIEFTLGVSTQNRQRDHLLQWAKGKSHQNIRDLKLKGELMPAFELGLMVPMVVLILAGPLEGIFETLR